MLRRKIIIIIIIYFFYLLTSGIPDFFWILPTSVFFECEPKNSYLYHCWRK